MHIKPHTEESKQKISETHKGIPNFSRRRKTIEKNGIILYQCGICKDFKPYEDFYKNKRTLLGITAECKKCHIKQSKELRDKDKTRERNREYMERERKKNPQKFRERERNRIRPKDEKYKARRELNNAVKRGEIIKPNNCQICGKETRLTAHHEDYSKPLDVMWLCYKCHGKLHRKE